MFSGCLQDFSRMFSGCSYGSCRSGGIWWSFQVKSMDFHDPKGLNGPQLFDDPQLLDDQLEVCSLITQKSTVTPPSPMVLLKKDNQTIVIKMAFLFWLYTSFLDCTSHFLFWIFFPFISVLSSLSDVTGSTELVLRNNLWKDIGCEAMM